MIELIKKTIDVVVVVLIFNFLYISLNTVNASNCTISGLDGNYITVEQGEKDENFTLMSEVFLEYTVHFQNLGSTTSEDLLIQDEFSEYLDAKSFESFEIIEMSHLSTGYQGFDFQNAIEIYFEGINLPSVEEDEENSKGYIKFRIRFHKDQTIPEYTKIENSARIIFNNQEAIVTNTVFNTMVSVLPFPVISVFPAALDYGEREIDELANKIIQLQNIGGALLTISNISFTNDAFSLRYPFEPRVEGVSVQIIEIFFNPIAATNYEGIMLIESNAGSLEIPLSGRGEFNTALYEFDLATTKVNLYPNPTSSYSTIVFENPTAEKQVFIITDMLGKMVKVIENQSSLEYNLDCTNFSKGLYHYQLMNARGGSVVVGKLVVD